MGSQLERKAESNLRLDKDGETTLIWSAKQRGAPIPREKAPAFHWCDQAAVHVSTAAPPSVRCSKTDTYAAEAEEIFAGRRATRPGEMKTAMNLLALSSRTADLRLVLYRQLGLIRRDVANLWVMATSDAPPLSPTPYVDGVGDSGDGRGAKDILKPQTTTVVPLAELLPST